MHNKNIPMPQQAKLEDYLANVAESVRSGYLLLLAGQRQQREINAALKKLGLTSAHCQMLYGIYELTRQRQKITQNDLARYIMLNKSMLSTVLKKLIAKGYVVREPDAADSRANNLFLTPAGEEIACKAFILLESVDKYMFENKGIDLTALNAALRLVAGVNEEEQCPQPVPPLYDHDTLP